MGEISTAPHCRATARQRPLLYCRIAWGMLLYGSYELGLLGQLSTYLSSLHSSSHFLESRAKFSNEVVLAVGVPVPNDALGRQRGKG